MNHRQWKKTHCVITRHGMTLKSNHYIKPRNRKAMKAWFILVIKKIQSDRAKCWREMRAQLLYGTMDMPKRKWWTLEEAKEMYPKKKTAVEKACESMGLNTHMEDLTGTMGLKPR